jgi:putative ABC transport system substrate-binding protein
MAAILVRRDVLVVEPNRAEVIALAAQRRLPAMYSFRQSPDPGGLMSHGVNVNEIHRRSATFVDKILKGAKPADLPDGGPTSRFNGPGLALLDARPLSVSVDRSDGRT